MKERDKESDYDYFGARYYDADPGRWLQVDLLAEKYPGWNPFNYVSNNSIRLFDPDGRLQEDANGNVIFNKTGTGTMSISKEGIPVTYNNKEATAFVTWSADIGNVTADDGTKIDASKATSGIAVKILSTDGSLLKRRGTDIAMGRRREDYV